MPLDNCYNPDLRWPRAGTLGNFLLLMFYMGKTDGEAFEAALGEPALDTARTTLASVRRRRYEFQEEGHPIPSNAHASKVGNVIRLPLVGLAAE